MAGGLDDDDGGEGRPLIGSSSAEMKGGELEAGLGVPSPLDESSSERGGAISAMAPADLVRVLISSPWAMDSDSMDELVRSTEFITAVSHHTQIRIRPRDDPSHRWSRPGCR